MAGLGGSNGHGPFAVDAAAAALLAGAIYLWRSRGERQRPLLMLVLALVMLVNVGIWTLPDASGEAPAQKSVE